MNNCKPLRGKRKPTMFSWDNFCADDVASAVRFYEEYKYHEAMLRDKEKKAWDNWLASDEFKIYKWELESKNYLVAENWYKDWLFDYCFGDVIE